MLIQCSPQDIYKAYGFGMAGWTRAQLYLMLRMHIDSMFHYNLQEQQ